ncbi:MAG: DUF2797 domain-containing protein [Flavobacteriales bacterium]|nr:DUF2797 domain-containing protein [Flavobacteriales bacterium]PIE86945.1 MAG: hypothetical protein CSA03_02885 [Bacteroidota bacterium]
MAEGNLHKMKATLGNPIEYRLDLSEELLMNDFIGKEIVLKWGGRINCKNCGKVTKKSFGQGFCYSCFISAPEAAECILRPELCRAHLGEGRDPEWEEKHHNQPHVVYLAASSAVKVGITRATQVPTRWIDQGASAAIRLAEVPNRFEAGRIEVALKDFFTDKTSWQRMLKNEVDDSIDLEEEKWSLEEQLPADITEYFSENDEIIELDYPVDEYPTKVKSLSFDKLPVIEGTLMGIKGQYLIFDGGRVLNIRKHTGYYVEIC